MMEVRALPCLEIGDPLERRVRKEIPVIVVLLEVEVQLERVVMQDLEVLLERLVRWDLLEHVV